MVTLSKNRLIVFVVCSLSLILVILYIVGSYFPGSRNWGVHFLGFLPTFYRFLYAALIAVSVTIIVTGNAERLISHLASALEKHPVVFFLAVLVGYIILAFTFRINAPLLDDSFTFIKNYTDYFAGNAPLAPWHEPLSFSFFYIVLRLLGHTNLGEFMRSFFIADLILGVIFLFTTFQIVRRIFDDSTKRLLVFLFLIIMPYSNFFFGYVEIYAFTLTLIALYVYLATLVFDRKIPFILLCIYGVFLTFVHYLNVLLWLSIAYLAFLEYKRGSVKSIIIGFSVSILMFVAILVIVNFDLTRLVDQSSVSHFLAMTKNVSMDNSYSQAFTQFSFDHLVELANYVLLMSPFTFVIIVVMLFVQPRLAKITPLHTFLAIITVCYVVLLGVIKIQQGLGNDWGVLASYFYFFNLFGVVVFFNLFEVSYIRVFSLILSITMIHSLIWFRLNSTVEPSIRRIESLLDTTMISQLGQYTINLHLTRHFDSQGDSLQQIELWKYYSALYPLDPRGYANRIAYLKELVVPNDNATRALYEQWIEVDRYNVDLWREYASYCMDLGNQQYAEGDLNQAIVSYRRANELVPNSAVTQNNFGSVYAEQGKIDTALSFFNRAIGLDSNYSDAYYNLGQVYNDLKDGRRALDAMRHATRLGNVKAKEFLRIRGIFKVD